MVASVVTEASPESPLETSGAAALEVAAAADDVAAANDVLVLVIG